MARVVTYSVSPRINPSEKGTPPKFYGHVQARGDVSLREMSERIQQTCTVHKSDVYAVLVALEDVITDALRGGEIVRLGDLGTFQIGISSKGAVTGRTMMSRSSRRRASTSVRVRPCRASWAAWFTRRWP